MVIKDHAPKIQKILDIHININNKKTVNAINLKTGKIIWNTPILNKDGILFDPLLINNQLFN